MISNLFPRWIIFSTNFPRAHEMSPPKSRLPRLLLPASFFEYKMLPSWPNNIAFSDTTGSRAGRRCLLAPPRRHTVQDHHGAAFLLSSNTAYGARRVPVLYHCSHVSFAIEMPWAPSISVIFIPLIGWCCRSSRGNAYRAAA